MGKLVGNTLPRSTGRVVGTGTGRDKVVNRESGSVVGMVIGIVDSVNESGKPVAMVLATVVVRVLGKMRLVGNAVGKPAYVRMHYGLL